MRGRSPRCTRDDAITLLLVDDRPAKLLTYQAVLEDLGSALVTASSPDGGPGHPDARRAPVRLGDEMSLDVADLLD